MDACDALIVGAGPAGSSCAWKLARAGLDVAVMDKQAFPRDKVCGGWITPPILSELEIDAAEFARGRVLQPITGFRTSRMGGREVQTDYGTAVSYGIRRCEFDDYLLRRSGARFLSGAALVTLERSGDGWVVNNELKTPLLIGAGGHFCPVARFMGAKPRTEEAIAAQEIEFEMTLAEAERCSIRGEYPELYFCRDMKGYAWCFRKENFINIGIGRLDPHKFTAHAGAFRDFLRSTGKIAFDLTSRFLGHAYLLFGRAKRELVGDGILLIGDSAGMAYTQSGEGIRPAIESGLLAAKVILDSAGKYNRGRLEAYRRLLHERFQSTEGDWAVRLGRRLPSQWIGSLAGALLATRWFSRRIVLDQWFLHRHEPAFNS
jgi:menaquinone-9 beta-reductase